MLQPSLQRSSNYMLATDGSATAEAPLTDTRNTINPGTMTITLQTVPGKTKGKKVTHARAAQTVKDGSCPSKSPATEDPSTDPAWLRSCLVLSVCCLSWCLGLWCCGCLSVVPLLWQIHQLACRLCEGLQTHPANTHAICCSHHYNDPANTCSLFAPAC